MSFQLFISSHKLRTCVFLLCCVCFQNLHLRKICTLPLKLLLQYLQKMIYQHQNFPLGEYFWVFGGLSHSVWILPMPSLLLSTLFCSHPFLIIKFSYWLLDFLNWFEISNIVKIVNVVCNLIVLWHVLHTYTMIAIVNNDMSIQVCGKCLS